MWTPENGVEWLKQPNPTTFQRLGLHPPANHEFSGLEPTEACQEPSRGQQRAEFNRAAKEGSKRKRQGQEAGAVTNILLSYLAAFAAINAAPEKYY